MALRFDASYRIYICRSKLFFGEIKPWGGPSEWYLKDPALSFSLVAFDPFHTCLSVSTIKVLYVIPGKITHLRKNPKRPGSYVYCNDCNPIILSELLFYYLYYPKPWSSVWSGTSSDRWYRLRTHVFINMVASAKFLQQHLTH